MTEPPGSGDSCRCGIPNLRDLRHALQMTQAQFSRAMSLPVTPLQEQASRDAAGRHRCLTEAHAILIHAWLQHPEYQRRVRLAGYVERSLSFR